MSTTPRQRGGGYGAVGRREDSGGGGIHAPAGKGASALLDLFEQPPSAAAAAALPPPPPLHASGGRAPGAAPRPAATASASPNTDEAGAGETIGGGIEIGPRSEADPLLTATIRAGPASSSSDEGGTVGVEAAGSSSPASGERRRWPLEGILSLPRRLGSRRSFCLHWRCGGGSGTPSKLCSKLPSMRNISPATLLTFLVGSTTSALYHCVFSLAMASSLSRSHAPPAARSSLLGPVAKMTALGVIVAGPLQVAVLGMEAPALYPSADLFLAPFLSQMGRTVDLTLYHKRQQLGEGVEEEDDTPTFLATFAALAALGMAASSLLCVLAARVKLANLGAFLPHAVICGFFSSIGVLVWTLAFSVDNGGAKVQQVLLGGGGDDVPTVAESLVHHAPSFLCGATMKIVCPRHPLLLPVFLVGIVLAAYGALLVTGTSLEESRADGWFWSSEELLGGGGSSDDGTMFFLVGPPPAPFGIVHSLWNGTIDLDAVRAGLPTVAAMAVIYTLRCSLHAVALKKLSEMLTKKKSKAAAVVDGSSRDINSNRLRTSSSASAASFDGWFGDIGGSFRVNGAASERGGDKSDNVCTRSTKLNNLRTLLWYGAGHLVSAVIGGFSALPAFAIGGTLYGLGVEGVAPQYGGIAMLLYCFCSNFTLVAYIPKALFSSLLVMGFLEFTWKWFVQSYFKTRHKWEWLVVPSIVVFAFVVPLLEAVVLGVAASTFIFVGAFYRSGIVKFASTGLTVRSTTDRMDDEADILDRRGDQIQILVLQNFVFFGNASSCLHYIQTMFEEPEVAKPLDFELPPVPRFIILDFNLVTGMDTSSVDIFAEIVELCQAEGCALLFSGLSREFRSILSCGGVKPIANVLQFYADLESALGKAEDGLLRGARKADRDCLSSFLANVDGSTVSGFHRALAQIETLQGLPIVSGLIGLEKYTTELAVSPNQFVCGSVTNPDMGLIPDEDRGLFFIERGSLQIERDPGCSYSLTRTSIKSTKNRMTLSALNARSATVGNLLGLAKTKRATASAPSRQFRLAKIGPGWVIGAVEGCSKIRNPGLYSALTECRLHYIPYWKLPQIEQDDPILALNLFKLLAHVVSRRQMSVIEQLGNLHSIITSPPVTKPRCRLTMGAINSAMHCVENN